jgi:hypothetical protein
MEVTVVSSQGKKEQLALDPTWSVTQLKKELHIRLPTLNIPAPEEQKLVSFFSQHFFQIDHKPTIRNVSHSFPISFPPRSMQMDDFSMGMMTLNLLAPFARLVMI